MNFIFAKNSIYNSFRNPLVIALFSLGLGLLIILLGLACEALGIMSLNADFPWAIMASMNLFYVMFAAVMLVISEHFLKTWGKTFYSFIGFLIVSVLVAWLFSGVSIYATGTFKTIYIVIILTFLLLMGISVAIKAVVRGTEKLDEKKRVREHKSDDMHLN